MQVEVFSNKKHIGTADLQVGDESMGHLYGELIPLESYYLLVQDTIREFWEKGDGNYTKINALNLRIRLPSGYCIVGAGGITIDDLEELPNESKRIDIAGVDFGLIRHYLENYK
ncbi:hypothetical protein [Mucilaginibacter terrae]|uniref:Uncharacterized protein n=1 Tax=Mucilaginibacter terrae TaxID=1955052 RepID=A0ABU3GUG0_9SPHI|nr:hypothetical protein [Mucilaginibacter terrae]MDT3403211.1 hypothetical protein [Mucilaginibacter terrae]